MAEEGPESALLHQMQAGQESVELENGADDSLEIDTPEADTDNSEEQVKEDTIADDKDPRATSPTAAPDAVVKSASVTAPSHLPTLASTLAAMDDSRSSSRASIKKPKTISGFVDESDDEDATSSTVQPPVNTLSNRPASPPSLGVQSTTSDGVDMAQSASAAQPLTDVPSAVLPSDTLDTKPPASLSEPTNPTMSTSYTKARLPHDTTGILEDRIKEDPRGDIDAWLALIAEHKRRNKLDDTRAVYERFLKVFPSAAEIWVEWAEMELSNDNFYGAEQIFSKSLLSVPNVQLWSVYLNYIRRRNDLTNDTSGTARSTVSQSYDFVLQNIGIDRDSGRIWGDYIQFVRTSPGQIGGTTWQDQQKLDLLRRAYQRAVCVPMSNVNALWKEYDSLERTSNKSVGLKSLQERSPAYMTARSANTALDNMTRSLVRTTLPRLPPALGFDGDVEYMQQVDLWRKWIDWEQEDPLVLKEEDNAAYKQRVLYVYKQAVMALRFWPEMWVDAAEWCFSNGMDKDGNDFLTKGIAANPESCLLAFKHADRLEITLPLEEGDDGIANRGTAVRAPYNLLLDALYDLLKKLKDREEVALAKVQEDAELNANIANVLNTIEDDDEDGNEPNSNTQESNKANAITAIKQGYAMQTSLLSKTISFAWIALTRAMRRVQGKGKVGDKIGGSRQILTDARVRGRITSDVYVASALIEHHVYKDPAGTKIFERGAKLYAEDETYILEYLKHLLSIGDTTNARVVFETSVNRLAQKPELVSKTKPLYAYFHKYESEYGELSQITNLERRMAELFPEDPKLSRFSSRYAGNGFDPTAVRPIISQTSQMRPKLIVPSIEQPISMQNSPRPQHRQTENASRLQYKAEASPRPAFQHLNNSPKRPHGEDSDTESTRPRKLARGESPLKGAAGRRLDQQRRAQGGSGITQQWQASAPPAFVIPRDITFLLSIMPRAETYTATRFNPEAMVGLIASTQIPSYRTWKEERDAAMQYGGMPSQRNY